MRVLTRFVAIGVLVAVQSAQASILGVSSQTVNLADADDAQRKATWSDPHVVRVNSSGLGWGTSADEGSRDFWLETTEPIALGESWRAPVSASIRATVEHAGKPGALYVRYSVDAKHWTEWQVLRAATPKDGAQLFEGEIRVPYREQGPYRELLQAYMRRDDVPWNSDEEALAKELIAGDSAFFRRQKPLIGYVQLLYEAQLQGGERIKGIKAEVMWAIGGTHTIPKDPTAYKDRGGPWRFKVE